MTSTTSTPTGDVEVAIDFLKRWSSQWVLSAIHPNQMGMETRTFTPETEAAARKWLEAFLPERNIYFHVNSLSRAQEKKAEIRDVKQVDYLHVDLDPDKNKDFETERERLFALLESLPQGVPEPSVVIDSGGGVQLFWKLAEPIVINGNVEAAEDAKRFNQQLESLLGGDSTHNIDRIMRLPGSVNYPNARKRAAGRQVAATQLLRFSDVVYQPTDFIQAPQVQSRAFSGSFSAPTKLVEIRGGNIKRLDQVSDLDAWNVPYRVKMMVMEGRNPEEGPKERDDSRSAWLFDCVCGLVRAGVPDETIYSVITDPDFKISASVLDKGSLAHKYAVKQIEDARLKAIDPSLLELNQRHAVISNLGGKCRVVEEVFEPTLGRTRLTKQSFEDFKNRYMNRYVELGRDTQDRPIRKPLGKWWLEHEHRRQYDAIVFSPVREVAGQYNLWRGFSYEARPGDCDDFLEHIRLNIAKGDEAVYEYILGWMARCVQHPDSPGQVSLVLRGPQGTGKGFLARTFGALWGRHFLHVSNPKHLVGNFNAHLRDCVVIFADEAFFAGDKQHESILKTLITEDTIMVEGKGVDAETSPNYTHVIMASNSHWVVPAGAGERRYCVIDVGEDKMQDTVYFKALAKKMESEGGYEALLHLLMTFDLSNFEVRNFPRTKALQDQKVFSLSPEEEWWFLKLCDSRTLYKAEGWLREASKQEIFDDYIEYAKKLNITRRLSQTALGKFLHRVTPTGYPRSYQKLTSVDMMTDGGNMSRRRMRVYYYELPSLDACREIWDQSYGSMTVWDENQEGMEL